MFRTHRLVLVLMVIAVTIVAAQCAFAVQQYLYVGGNSNNSIYRIDITNNTSSVLVSGVAAPFGIAAGKDGNLYVATGAGISRYNATSGAFVDQFIAPGSGGLVQPTGLRFGPDGNLYVSEAGIFGGSDTIRRYDGVTGAPLPAAGQSGAVFVPQYSAGLQWPIGLAFMPDGDLLSTAWIDRSVLRFDGTTGNYTGQKYDLSPLVNLAAPIDTDVTPDGNVLVTEASWNPGWYNSVIRFNGVTGVADHLIPTGMGQSSPRGVRVAANGQIFLVSNENGKVMRFSSAGALIDTPMNVGAGPGLWMMDIQPVPEPSSLIALLAGGIGLVGLRFRRK